MNYWFYTLSTISQTLAALVALGATFVIFSLDKLNKNILDYRQRLIYILKESDRNTPESTYYALNNINLLKYFNTNLYSKIQAEKQDLGIGENNCVNFVNHYILIEFGNKNGYSSTQGLEKEVLDAYAYLNRIKDYYSDSIEFKRKIICQTIVTVIINSLTIILSVILLSYSEPHHGFLTVTIIVFICSIISTILLIIKLVRKD